MHRQLFLRAGTAFAVGIFAIAAYAAVQDVSLKPKPKSGDTHEYKVNATFTTDQGEVTFAQKRVETITDVKPEGSYTVKEVASETKISFGGQDLPDQPDVTATSEIGPDGLVGKVTTDAAGPANISTYRILNLHAFKAPDAPAKVGDEIKFDIPADSKKGTPAVKSDYKVVAMEKVKDWDCVKLTFTSEETEGDKKSSIKGSIWLSTADGSIVKSEEEWTDVQPDGAPFPVSGKFNTVRVK